MIEVATNSLFEWYHHHQMVTFFHTQKRSQCKHSRKKVTIFHQNMPVLPTFQSCPPHFYSHVIFIFVRLTAALLLFVVLLLVSADSIDNLPSNNNNHNNVTRMLQTTTDDNDGENDPVLATCTSSTICMCQQHPIGSYLCFPMSLYKWMANNDFSM